MHIRQVHLTIIQWVVDVKHTLWYHRLLLLSSLQVVELLSLEERHSDIVHIRTQPDVFNLLTDIDHVQADRILNVLSIPAENSDITSVFTSCGKVPTTVGQSECVDVFSVACYHVLLRLVLELTEAHLTFLIGQSCHKWYSYWLALIIANSVSQVDQSLWIVTSLQTIDKCQVLEVEYVGLEVEAHH